MNGKIESIIEDSKKEAQEIMRSSLGMRKEFAVGRPNSSQESTIEGTLEAFSTLVSNFIPQGYTPK